MPKVEPQSFEVAPYSDVEFGMKEAQQVVAQVIGQIFADLKRDAPAHAVWGDMTGNQLKIHYHVYTMHLPVRMKQIEEEANEVFKQTVSFLKKEFKSRTGKTLKLSEQKELANRAIEKVSLNERYAYKAWRFYELSF